MLCTLQLTAAAFPLTEEREQSFGLVDFGFVIASESRLGEPMKCTTYVT